jgi:hypothetical protein
MFEPEEWKTIPENDRYMISNYGRVLNAETGHIMKLTRRASNEDFIVRLNKNLTQIGCTVSHLVGAAFLKGYDPQYMMVHQDADLSNNHIDNLIQDHGTRRRGRSNSGTSS